LIGTLLELTKARITVAVTLSAATGYLLFEEPVSWQLVYPALGVFLLACGSSALNEVQERRIDARMARTRGRPLPTSRIDPPAALFIAVLLMLLGLTLLASVDRRERIPIILTLAGFSVFWYNGVYTYLKRVTVFAVVPGALVGAVPPLIGWAAAGGVITDPLILFVGFFFFLWQIPHFWLLVLRRGGEYEEAGLPSLTRTFSRRQIRRLTFMWILAVAGAGILLGLLRTVSFPWNAALFLASVWLAERAFTLLGPRDHDALFRTAFVNLILYAVAVMASLSLNAVA
jgi:protoheme IX farnesyltransferase